MTGPIVSAEWLNKHIKDDDLVILDASQKITADNVAITGARYFDIKIEFSAESEFPNTFPSVEQFETGCQKLGIDKDNKIVIYDNKGVFSSPRVWWMFKTMGHQNVAVLDGGLPDWLANGFETETGFDSEFEQGDFITNFDAVHVKDYDFVCENINNQKELLIDARSTGRFDGTAPELREGLRSGNIPNSINIPYTEVLENGKFKSVAQLNEVFADLKAAKKPFVFTCGSGITACIILLASELVMEHSSSVYDGSWTEFAILQD